MLFAELHGKLDPNSPDLERREDVLTSTVFGTLLIAGAVDLLTQWLNYARRLGADGRLGLDALSVDVAQPVKYWFWPSLAGGTQPDVLLQIGHRLLVIEAKYGSSKSAGAQDVNDTSEADSDKSMSDQLLREWRACRHGAPGIAWYPSELRDAIEHCQIDLLYLVSARRTSSSLQELRASQLKIRALLNDEARLWLFTWQDLHGLLMQQTKSGLPASPWVSELARVLDRRRNLAAFLGFPEAMEHVGQQHDSLAIWATGWSQQKFSSPFAVFQDVDLEQFHRTVSVIERWTAERRGESSGGYFDQFSHVDVPTLERLADHLEQQQIRWIVEADND
jgi:hypothetical protein